MISGRFIQQGCKAALPICLLFLISAGGVFAKKPVDPPPDPPDDPCLTEDFHPDFAFYRDTKSGRTRTYAFFVSDVSGCERKVTEFTRDEGLIHGLSFSATDEGEGLFLGRIVWKTILTPVEVVWGYDFAIEGPDLIPVDGPYRVLDNEGDTSTNISNAMDLSPDQKTLAYYFWNSDHDGSIRIVNVDDCANQGCAFDTPLSLAIAEKSAADQEYLEFPAWGPLGTRIYFRRTVDAEPAIFNLQYVDMPDGWNGLVSDLASFEPVESTLVSTLTQPDFPPISGVSGGIVNGSEVLAVLVSTDSGCGFTSFIDVETCGGACLPEPVFFGVRPSITRQGIVVHNYYKENANLCSKWGGTVGLYDGTAVSTVLDGFMPDAGGGMP